MKATIHRVINTTALITIAVLMYLTYQSVQEDIKEQAKQTEIEVLHQCEEKLFEKVFNRPAPDAQEIAMLRLN